MDSAEEFADALQEMEGDELFGGSFNWNGQDYPCVASSRSRSKKLGAGGYAFDSDLVIFVRLALFDKAIPEQKQQLVFDGLKYQIDRIGQPQGDPFIRLDCNEPFRGA